MAEKVSYYILAITFILLISVTIYASQLPSETTNNIYTTSTNILFRYGISGAKHMNELNTSKGIFTKDMVDKDPVKTNLDLNQDELDTIFKKMVEIDFFSYPRNYQPQREGDVHGYTTPSSIYYLEFKDDTGTKIVQWSDKYYVPDDAGYEKLMELADQIIDIIEAKPEYKKLPKPTAAYL
jgi:hypothetical protein